MTNNILQDILFCNEIMHNKANDIIEALNNFIEENYIEWEKCVGLILMGLGPWHDTKVVVPNVKWAHCSIHREALAWH